jgi:hypothetical protein
MRQERGEGAEEIISQLHLLIHRLLKFQQSFEQSAHYELAMRPCSVTVGKQTRISQNMDKNV